VVIVPGDHSFAGNCHVASHASQLSLIPSVEWEINMGQVVVTLGLDRSFHLWIKRVGADKAE